MTSKLTRERIELIANFHRAMTIPPSHDEIEELARIALAAMDSEPVAEVVSIYGDPEGFGEREIRPLVGIQQMPYGTKLYRHAQPAKGLELAGWQFKSVNGDWLGLIDEHGKNQAVRDGYEVREVFAMADGVNERDQVRREHAEWSQATFGNVGPVGPLKHLSKEALEAAAEPDDLSEWADMQFLMWDAQRRAGITDEQITKAMIEKLVVNKHREWPEPKEGEPRLHIKEQPAPVVPDEREAFNVWNNDTDCPLAGLNVKQAAWLAWLKRSGTIKSFEPATDEFEVWARSEGLIHDSYGLRTVNTSADVARKAWNACRAAMLQAGNSPVTSDGWCRTCRPMTMSDMRFVVCPECGNKRCPHANDHKNDCTGSNEPGQEGSAYPAAPQQEVNNV